jgi:hypothetical protein
VNYYDPDCVPRARERLEQRRREADVQRLAREIHGTTRIRPRLWLAVGFTLGIGRRASQLRLEA